MVKVNADYVAVHEDEISVNKGDVVQIVANNQQNSYLVHCEATENSPAAEGWIPAHLLQPKEHEIR